MLGLFAIAPATHASAQGSTFSITPIFADKASKDAGYFDITAKPGQKVTFAMNVKNMTKKSEVIRVQIADAYTTDAGQIAYSPDGPKDKSAKYRLSDLAGHAQKVALAAGATKKVSFTITVPQTGLKGILLGSLYAIDNASYGKSSSGAMTLGNKYAMYSAIELRTSTKYVHPALKLMKFKLGMQNGKASALATIQNYEPQMFGKMTVNAKVYKGNATKPMLTRKVSDYAMAPNSHFDFGLYTNNAFTPGKYTIDLTAHSGDRTWHFRRTITVTRDQVKQINDAASLKPDNQIPWWLIALIVLMLIIILLLIILLLKRRKKDDEPEQK